MKKKYWLFTALLLMFQSKATEFIFTEKHAFKQAVDKGCLLKGKIFPAGYRIAMNKEELDLAKQETGVRASDGYAVMMQCIYLVDPNHSDHPEISQRKYVWVAS